MKKHLAALSTTVLIGVAPFAMAASSTDLTVTGSITPAACTPNLADGGVVDYGKIPVKDLNLTTTTVLTTHDLQLTVSCDAPASFGLKAIDNKSGTTSNSDWFGIGMTEAGERLGFVVTTMKNPVADSQVVRTIISTDNGATWRATHHHRPNWLMSVADSTDLSTPIAVQDLAFDLTIGAVIARADTLTLTDETAFNGSVTYELNYL